MTPNQKKQFNQMRSALLTLSKDFQNPVQLRKNSEKKWGLGFEEAMEMAYENMLEIARAGVKGIKAVE